MIAQALASGRRYLNEYEAMQLLAAYAIPVAETLAAHSPDEAAETARRPI
jgi:acyl-CoA synthetase (NDP forming)